MSDRPDPVRPPGTLGPLAEAVQQIGEEGLDVTVTGTGADDARVIAAGRVDVGKGVQVGGAVTWSQWAQDQLAYWLGISWRPHRKKS